jgi:hypothetical protein
MGTEEAGKEKSQIGNELLVASIASSIGFLQVQRQGNNVRDRCERLREHVHKPLVIVIRSANLQTTNLREALEGDVSEVGNIQESGQESINDGCFEDITQWDPIQEAEQGLEGRLDEAGLVGGVENFGAQLEDGGKLLGHGGLQVAGLDRSHLILGKVKDLLGQQAQDGHVVFTDGKAGVAGGDDLIDECGPVVRPFLLENGDQNQVELVQEGALSSELLFGSGIFDDEVNDEVANTWRGSI